MLGFLNGVPGKLATLVGRLTSARAGYLDNLSAGAVAQASTALSTANWTNARAANLDYNPRFRYMRVFSATGSTTFVTPITGKYRIRVLGAGASGPVRTETKVTGGGGGGYCETYGANLTANTTLTVTVGAAGKVDGTSGVVAAANGGNSSVSGSGLTTMTANGGTGGSYGATGVSVSGGAGGTATGGDVNYTGGSGGSISSGATSNYRVATGGGSAASYLGNGGNGGSLTGTWSLTNSCLGTGGGGVGGNGGSFSSGIACSGVGGGSGGSAIDNQYSTGYQGPNWLGTRAAVDYNSGGPYVYNTTIVPLVNGFNALLTLENGVYVFHPNHCLTLFNDPLYPLLGAGGCTGVVSGVTYNIYTATPTGGGGAGAAAVTNDWYDIYAGTCGGSGGYASHNMNARGTHAGRGGGAGGVNGSSISGASISEGGDGLVIIEW